MATTYDPTNALARTPPQGWNSYNPFGGMHGLPEDTNRGLPGNVALEERLILETADALVESGMRDAGYVYVNLDDRWQNPITPRDASGRLQVDLRRFPNGVKFLADRLHERGLKFGIYTVANLYACGGEEGCGPNGFPAIGSLGHERIDAETFAEWEVDFLKIDWCGVDEAGNRGHAAEVFAEWNQAIASTDRGIVLSASTWGEEQEESWAPGLTHLWRTDQDLHPNWDSVRARARATAEPRWRSLAGPTSGWNDPDFLHVGHPNLTPDESWTHLVLWALLSSPLIAGNDVRTMTETTRQMLLHPWVLAVDRDPSAPATVEAHGAWDVWRRRLSTGEEVTAVVNLSSVASPVPPELHRDGTDISWTDTSELVSPHGVRLTVQQDREK